jgi:hypothetical protein
MRNILRLLAFLLGVLALIDVIDDLVIALSRYGDGAVVILLPLLLGLVLALISARTFVSREWQKGPALLLAAALFARTALKSSFTRLSQLSNSWGDVFFWLAIEICWMGIAYLLAVWVYRSSDHLLAVVEKKFASLIRKKI